MIVCCPGCRVRWRLDRPRHEGKQLTLRCARCQRIFKLRVPVAPIGESPRVVVGHGDPETALAIGNLLSSAGYRWILGRSGEEVMSLMKEAAPRMVLIDAALPGLPSFALIEAIRKSAMLGKVKVLLLGTVYNHAAYRSPPRLLHGADDYLDSHRLTKDLVSKIRKLLEG